MERFDEVFRTLLIIATAVIAFSTRVLPGQLTRYVFQTLLFVLITILIWATSVLWGKHRWALTMRLIAFGTLLISILRSLGTLLIFITPTGRGHPELLVNTLVLEVVPSLLAITAGGVYLRLSRKDIGAALLLWMGLAGNVLGLIVVLFHIT